MTKPRPPAGWQAVGAVVALLVSCQGAAGQVPGSAQAITSWTAVTTTYNGPARPVAPILDPMPTSRRPGPQRPSAVPRPVVVSVVPVVPSVAAAKAYARGVLGATQYACLDQIATHESNWNPLDRNRSSGAYGIAQALPGSRMASIGPDWRTNPLTQVRWMIWYVTVDRYGSPCAAWQWWMGHSWY